MPKDTDFQIDHDKIFKLAFKNKDRFRQLLKFALGSKKFNVIAGDQIEFIDTELLKKQSSGDIQECRADIIAKVNLKKEIGTDLLVAIIVEHKSHIEPQKKIFLQALKYNVALLESHIYPITTILLVHGNRPLNISSDLQSAFGWSEQLKDVFGGDSFNFGLNVIDLNQISDEDIKDKAGDIASFCFAFKHVWNMTRDKIKSIFEMCYQEGKASNYYENVSILGRYILQATNYSKEEFVKIESEVIKSEEDQMMKSTYNRLIDEGMEKGIERGIEKGIEKGMEKGIERGMEKGIEKGRAEVALRMLEQNMELQLIAQITNLSVQQLQKLKK